MDSAAPRLVAEAEQKAAGIRQQARVAGREGEAEGYQQADSLTAKAKGPLAQTGRQARRRSAAEAVGREGGGDHRRGEQAGGLVGGRGEAAGVRVSE